MMNIEANKRFSFAQIRQHPWYTRRNPLLTADGKVSDPIALATQMLAGLRIDLSAEPTPSQRQSQPEAMDVDSQPTPGWSAKLPATQPETPISDALFDWERPARRTLGTYAISATQPLARTDAAAAAHLGYSSALEALADEPTMSQFSQTPGVPLSLTQHARQFRDIVPSYSLTRFFSHVPPALLVQMLADALHQLNVPQPGRAPAVDPNAEHVATLKVKTLDGRRQGLHGDVLVDRYRLSEEQELLEVRFVKVKGDPLEWRRFFKKVTLLCRDAVYSGDRGGNGGTGNGTGNGNGA
jgi:serine/threonine-protein kinase Chk1